MKNRVSEQEQREWQFFFAGLALGIGITTAIISLKTGYIPFATNGWQKAIGHFLGYI